MLTVATKLPDDLARVFLFEVAQRGTTKSRLARDLIEQGLAGSDSWFSGEGPKPEPVVLGHVQTDDGATHDLVEGPVDPRLAATPVHNIAEDAEPTWLPSRREPSKCPDHPEAGTTEARGLLFCEEPGCPNVIART